MKVQVNIEFQQSKGRFVSTLVQPQALKVAVNPADTLLSLKQRILTLEPIPFPDQEFQLNDSKLGDEQRIGDLNFEVNQSLRLVVNASEDVFVKQLGQLLQPKPLTVSELGLLYCHQHGAKVSQALSILGIKEQLGEFLKGCKQFTINKNSGLVGHASDVDTKLQKGKLESIKEEYEKAKDYQKQGFTVSVAVSLNSENEEIQLQVTPDQTVQHVSQRALAAALMPFPMVDMVFGGKELKFEQKLGDVGIREGASLCLAVTASQAVLVEQLAELLGNARLSEVELSDKYCYKFGAPVSRALKLVGVCDKFKDFLRKHPSFDLKFGLVSAVAAKEEDAETEAPSSNSADAESDLEQDYLEADDHYLSLDKDIASCASIEKTKDALELVTRTVCESGFVHVQGIVQGGSIARGTACQGSSDAQAVLLLEDMPLIGRSKWAPPLLRAVALMLRAALAAVAPWPVEDVSVKHGAVRVQFEGGIAVDLELEAVDSGNAIFAERRARFFEKQPESVKMTMRLLKWWRNQQTWSDESSRPSDYVIELLAAFVASGNSAPKDQVEAVEQVMSLMANFRQLNVTWPEFLRSYDAEDMSDLLLIERPLIVDPVDPESNVDAGDFDYRQLEKLAASFTGLL
eukprot:TRINITY_DN40078_c0_g1_i1.p1 TRINITY_DN40078_c0_g1~~TRINITY_DN40078_c0_g1_i1.p1  ORF type:complete len:630 (+),score=178.96 TRINITY_DN40078_c0_g1_i1:203-2092(+)